MKTLNSFILLATLLVTAHSSSALEAGDPANPGLDRARRLAVPAEAAEYREAVNELSLLHGYDPGFQDPAARAGKRGTTELVPLRSLHRDPETGEWKDREGRVRRVLATNEDYDFAAVADDSPSVRSPQIPVVAEAAAGFPGEVIEEVIVPVPSEIFMVMDKLGRPDWRSELRKSKTPTFSNRVDVALLLGSVVAEGFVAVEAEDQDAVERIGKDVLRLSESLGLKDTVLPHTNSILEASKNNHWEIVRVELDKTQKTVRDTMEQRRDAELGQCVSLGGWLRGTDAVTSLIAKNYTSDAAELLNQPDIIRHFQKELKKLATRNGKLKSLMDGLGTIAQVIGTGDEAPNAAGVQTIHETAVRLVKSITTSASSAQ